MTALLCRLGQARSGYVVRVAEHAAGWRQGPDGRWYPPINERAGLVHADQDQLAEVAALVNSGALTSEIDEVVDDPELAV